MSTPSRVRVAFHVGVLAAIAAACSDSAPHVSYAGLDRAVEPDELPPVVVGVVVDATGPGAAAGRDFADALRAAFAAPGTKEPEPAFRVHVLDDRGAETGVRGAAERLEVDPAVHVAIVAPGLGRATAAARLAPRTVVVCAGCDAVEVEREGAFALSGGPDAARAAGDWVRGAMRGTWVWDVRKLAIALRETPPPAGYARFEGAGPASEPSDFRAPKPAIRK